MKNVSENEEITFTILTENVKPHNMFYIMHLIASFEIKRLSCLKFSKQKFSR